LKKIKHKFRIFVNTNRIVKNPSPRSSTTPPKAGRSYKKGRGGNTPEEIARRKEFDEEFNLWLEGVRGGNL